MIQPAYRHQTQHAVILLDTFGHENYNMNKLKMIIGLGK